MGDVRGGGWGMGEEDDVDGEVTTDKGREAASAAPVPSRLQHLAA